MDWLKKKKFFLQIFLVIWNTNISDKESTERVPQPPQVGRSVSSFVWCWTLGGGAKEKEEVIGHQPIVSSDECYECSFLVLGVKYIWSMTTQLQIYRFWKIREQVALWSKKFFLSNLFLARFNKIKIF